MKNENVKDLPFKFASGRRQRWMRQQIPSARCLVFFSSPAANTSEPSRVGRERELARHWHWQLRCVEVLSLWGLDYVIRFKRQQLLHLNSNFTNFTKFKMKC